MSGGSNLVRCKKCQVCLRHATKITRREQLCAICRGVVKHINRREMTEKTVSIIKGKRLNPKDLEYYKKLLKNEGHFSDRHE